MGRLLFVLFWTQFIAGAIVPEEHHDTELLLFSAAYIVLAVWIFANDRRNIGPRLRDGFRTPYAELSD